MITEIFRCRICGNKDLIPVMDLGEQELTGIFPPQKDQSVTSGPLQLVRCNDEFDPQMCGLLQLRHSCDISEMYGGNYGYRSSLNQSMVSHLNDVVKKILDLVALNKDDLLLDIGSNDCTLLKMYPSAGLTLVGMDPSGYKFRNYYPDHVTLIPDFFSAERFEKTFGQRKAKVITSIAMFYDLEAPLDFMREVYNILSDDGIWVFEQSYMPAMLESHAYDTICHEHLEFYGLKQIKWMADRVGFKIIAIEFNKVNGGSFLVAAAKKDSPYPEAERDIYTILEKERLLGLSTEKPYQIFNDYIFSHRDQLINILKELKDSGKTVLGYGASTKGNVLLQFCRLTTDDIPFIADVNTDKIGCYTPGTHIPIISETEAGDMQPDYYIVFPWHFRENILEREKEYLEKGGQFLFPLPMIEIVKG